VGFRRAMAHVFRRRAHVSRLLIGERRMASVHDVRVSEIDRRKGERGPVDFA
jgi:hypothetical protein